MRIGIRNGLRILKQKGGGLEGLMAAKSFLGGGMEGMKGDLEINPAG